MSPDDDSIRAVLMDLMRTARQGGERASPVYANRMRIVPTASGFVRIL